MVENKGIKLKDATDEQLNKEYEMTKIQLDNIDANMYRLEKARPNIMQKLATLENEINERKSEESKEESNNKNK
jgi:hypothetical protein